MARAALPQDPEIARLVLAARAAHWPDEPTGSGHWRIITPSRGSVYIPSTPSDWRSVHNCEAELKRAGLEVDRVDKVRKTGQGRPQHSPNIPSRLNFRAQKFADALVAEMDKRKLSQEMLADLCGVSGGSLSLWRRCMGRPSLETLIQIQQRLGWADYYGTPIPDPEPEPEPEPAALVEPEPEPEPAAELPQPPLDPQQLLAPPALSRPDPSYEDQMPYLRGLDALNQLAAQYRQAATSVARLENQDRRKDDLIAGLRSELARKDQIIAGLEDQLNLATGRQTQHNGSGKVLLGVKRQVS